MTPTDFVLAYAKHGSIKAVARNEGITYDAARKAYVQAVDDGLMRPLRVGRKTAAELKDPTAAIEPPKPSGRLRAKQTEVLPLPPEGMINVYLFTCAQNDTLVHEDMFNNVQAFLAHMEADERVNNAELHVSRFTYIRAGLGASGDKAKIVRKETLYGGKDLSYANELSPYFSDERIEVAPGLVWCGELNILPTAARPLSGLESYTGRKSTIVPHVKIAMESVASMADEATKFCYTTGAITQRNYIQRKAGFKGEFHHCYGLLLVEVDHTGSWWCRHLNADSEGTFYDLDLRVKDGTVERGQWIDTIVWGDAHVAISDAENWDTCWGPDGMLDQLRPQRQVLHDLLDFRARSHHEIKDPVKRFVRFVQDQDNVWNECCTAGKALEDQIERDWCETVVVDSNHHRHLGRWLREENGLMDPVNAEFWSDMWGVVYAELRANPEQEPNYLALALRAADYQGNARILGKDESYVVCEDQHGGIELGLHGDIGPNGSRGSPLAFARMGRKMVVGHTHKAGIVDGVYVVGTSSDLRPDYTWGPGAWSHTHCVVYENGKRALVTIWKGKYRA